jgi:phosphoserine phosphatase
METNKEKLYIFDVCGTMFHSNTTYDFLGYYFRRKNKTKYLICRTVLSYPSKALLIILNKLGLRIELRLFLIGLLKGENEKEVGISAEAFVKDFLLQRKNHRVQDILDQALKQHENVILASASLNPVVKSIAGYFNVKAHYSTVLEQTKERLYSGKLVQDIKGEKLAHLKQVMDLDKFDLIVLTDNLDDISLVKIAEKALIISKPRTLNIWKRLLDNHPNAEIIHV